MMSSKLKISSELRIVTKSPPREQGENWGLLKFDRRSPPSGDGSGVCVKVRQNSA